MDVRLAEYEAGTSLIIESPPPPQMDKLMRHRIEKAILPHLCAA